MTAHASLFLGIGLIMNSCEEKKVDGVVIVDNGFIDKDCQESCVSGSNSTQSITTISSGVFDSQISLLPATAPYTVTPIVISDWCQYDVVAGGIRLYGTSPTGNEKQVFSVSNSCGEFHVVVDIITPSSCITPTNISKDVTSNKGNLSAQVKVTDGSSLVSAAVPDGITYQFSAGILYLSGTITTPATYSAVMSTACGNYTVSGNILVCSQVSVLSTSGASTFDKKTPASFQWNLSSAVTIESVEDLPNGLSVSTAGNSVSISGTPSENTGSGTISVKVKNSCSNLELKIDFKEKPCNEIKVVGDVGSSLLGINQFATFGKVLGGETPIELVNYDGIPKGMSVALVNNAGVYSILVSGTPSIDPCAESENNNVCGSATVTVSNECGEKEIPISYSLNTIQLPVYCIGVYEWIDAGATGTLKVWGVTQNSVITIGNNATPSELTVDSNGNGTVVVSKSGLACPTISHPSCALIKKEAVSLCTTI
jgi:hypothetical protein